MKHVLRIALLGLATTSLLHCTDAGDDSGGTASDDPQVDRDDGRPLTPPSADAPEAIVRGYLADRVGGAAAQLTVVGQAQARGVTHLRFEQVVDGLRVHGAFAKAAVSARGELIQVIHRLGPTAHPLPARAIESDALRTALVEYGYGIEPARVRTTGNVTTFARTDELYREPRVERVAYVDGKALRVGFLVETWSRIGNQLDYTLIGGDGQIVWSERRTSNDSYRVYTEDPGKGGTTVVDGTGKGWLGAGAQTTHAISGPNVRAYLDTDNNNTADSAATTGADPITDGNFVAAADLVSTPATANNRAAAIQNLFYFNNYMHDRLEAVGFDNANGNFEGNDPVNAEAQDGGGTDNANFSTPADGSSPRMQMYLWTGAAPDAYVDLGAGEVYGAHGASFGPALANTGSAFPLAAANVADGCTAISSASVSGKTAIVDRGTCDFTVKVRNARRRPVPRPS